MDHAEPKFMDEVAKEVSYLLRQRDEIYLEYGKGKREWYLTVEDAVKEPRDYRSEPWRRRRNR